MSHKHDIIFVFGRLQSFLAPVVVIWTSSLISNSSVSFVKESTCMIKSKCCLRRAQNYLRRSNRGSSSSWLPIIPTYCHYVVCASSFWVLSVRWSTLIEKPFRLQYFILDLSEVCPHFANVLMTAQLPVFGSPAFPFSSKEGWEPSFFFRAR